MQQNHYRLHVYSVEMITTSKITDLIFLELKNIIHNSRSKIHFYFVYSTQKHPNRKGCAKRLKRLPQCVSRQKKIKSECFDYQRISFLSIARNVLTAIRRNRILDFYDTNLPEASACFL